MLSLIQIDELAQFLGRSHKFVNKDFFSKLIKRFMRITTGEVKDSSQAVRILHIISGLTMIEKNMGLSSIWF